jgi:hypothetical protein
MRRILATIVVTTVRSLLIGVLILVIHVTILAAEPNRYPNEVVGYQFYSSATWRALAPFRSTMADVRKALGKPTECHDIANHNPLSPYPGDEKAVQPVWTYDLNEQWQMLVYFVKSTAINRRLFDESLYNTLYSIEYIPKKPVRFDLSRLPSGFGRYHAEAADAAWDEYSDGTGLVYAVYTSRVPYGEQVPGDLNRIIYGPPKELLPNQRNKKMVQPPSADSSPKHSNRLSKRESSDVYRDLPNHSARPFTVQYSLFTPKVRGGANRSQRRLELRAVLGTHPHPAHPVHVLFERVSYRKIIQ